MTRPLAFAEAKLRLRAGRPQGSGPLLRRVEARWGGAGLDGAPPDWVKALAASCDDSTQVEVAARIGCSAAAVNQVLAKVYEGRLDRIEARVRGTLMAETVDCPVVGEISRSACMTHQGRREDAIAVNPLLPKLYRACRDGCAHSLIRRKRHAE